MALKAIFLIGIVVVLVKIIDFNAMVDLFSKMAIPFFALTVLVCILDKASMGIKWNLLLSVFRVNVPFWAPIVAYLRAKIIHLVTPSSIGTDAYKTFYLKKFDNRLIPILSSIFIERLIGAISSIAFVAVLIYYPAKKIGFPHSNLIALFGLFLFFCTLAIVAVAILFAGKIKPLAFPKFIPESVARKLNEFLVAMTMVNSKKGNVFLYFLCSIVEKIFYGAAIFFAAKSIHIMDIDFLYIISAAPLLALLERLPVSIAALGLREGLFIILFRPYFPDPTVPFTIALVLRAADVAMIVICLFIWFGRYDKKDSEREIQFVDKEIKILQKQQFQKS